MGIIGDYHQQGMCFPMYLYSKYYLYVLWLLVFFLGGCSESAEMVNVQPRQTITLRAASAVVENSVPFSSYSGATVDIIVNGEAIQTFTNQGNVQDGEDWVVEIDGVSLGRDNTIDVEWYIQQGTQRYTIATQSGSFFADPEAVSTEVVAPYETDAFDHDADAVSNLIEVNAGGFPVPATQIPEVLDIVAPGTFIIGSPSDEPGAYDNELATTTAIVNNYSIGKFEVTYSEFQTYVESIGTQDLPTDNDWGGGDLPVTNVSWSEAYAYTAWLSRITGETYRLPTEAEWEYAARGNTTTPYFTGQTISSHSANFNTTVLDAVYFKAIGIPDPNPIIGVFRDEGTGIWNEYTFDAETNQEQLINEFEEVQRDTNGILILDSSRNLSLVLSQENGFVYLVDNNNGQLGELYSIADRSPSIAEFIGKQPVPVGSFSPNAYGLYDMHGNVFEYTCSMWQSNYRGAEQNCVDPELADTPDFTMIKRGGSWNLVAGEIRSANRGWNNENGQRLFNTGFRVVKEP